MLIISFYDCYARTERIIRIKKEDLGKYQNLEYYDNLEIIKAY